MNILFLMGGTFGEALTFRWFQPGSISGIGVDLGGVPLSLLGVKKKRKKFKYYEYPDMKECVTGLDPRFSNKITISLLLMYVNRWYRKTADVIDKTTKRTFLIFYRFPLQ